MCELSHALAIRNAFCCWRVRIGHQSPHRWETESIIQTLREDESRIAAQRDERMLAVSTGELEAGACMFPLCRPSYFIHESPGPSAKQLRQRRGMQTLLLFDDYLYCNLRRVTNDT